MSLVEETHPEATGERVPESLQAIWECCRETEVRKEGYRQRGFKIEHMSEGEVGQA